MVRLSVPLFFGLLLCFPLFCTAFSVIAPQGAVQALENRPNFKRFAPVLAFGLSAPPPTADEKIVAPLFIADINFNGGDACEIANFLAYAQGRANNTILMVQRGGCAFIDKAKVAEEAGALALVVYHNIGSTQADSLLMFADEEVGIVVEGFSLFEGLLLLDIQNTYGQLTVEIAQLPAPPEQKQALLDFYATSGGTMWQFGSSNFSNWKSNTDPCIDLWDGITCLVDGSISIISLSQSRVQGTITAGLASLVELSILDLSNNQMSGTLPAFISDLTELTSLNLANNNFTGELPDLTTLQKLAILTVAKNNLVGTIDPRIYTDMVALEFLELGYNHFTGSLPDVISLPNIRTLSITSNQISGDLQNIDMSAIIAGLPGVGTKLTLLDLSDNLFGGVIPSYFGDFRQLTTLLLYGNSFSGEFNSNFRNLTELRVLDISRNNFAGEVPSDNLPPNLLTFRASHNFFTSLPSSFTRHRLLQTIDFSYNRFAVSTSEIITRLYVPASAAEAAAGLCLQYIDFSHNQIFVRESVFQLTIYQWPNLITFKLNNNNISRVLSIAAVDNNFLKTLDLSNNDLEGSITPSFSLFVGLVEFKLTNTKLRFGADGFLPDTFYPDYNQTTYYPEYNISCPAIRMGATRTMVDMDPIYHNFELCKCEPNFRRRDPGPFDNVTNVVIYDEMAPTSIHLPMRFRCIPCPPLGMRCPGKQNDRQFIIEKNYYPTPSALDPVILLDCPACVGTLPNGTFSCADYHDGRLCSQCAEGTFMRGNSCQRCAPVGSLIVVVSIVILVILIIGFTMFTIMRRQLCGGCFGTTLGSQFFAQGSPSKHQLKESTSLSVSSGEMPRTKSRPVKENSVAALLIAINFYQTVSALSQYYELPVSISQLLSAVKVVTSVTGSGLGLECLHHRLNEYKHLYTAIMLEPVICLGFVLVVYALGKLYVIITRHKPLIFTEWEITCAKMALFVINLLFFPITSTAINAFRCTKDPYTTISYNSQYPYSECDKIPMASRVVALLFYSIGVMVLFSGLIFVYIRKSRDPGGEDPPGTVAYVINKSFGFFFLHFRDRYYWFAIVILLRRFVISLITSLVPVNAVLGFGLNNLVLATSAFLVLVKTPFRTHIDNLLETTTLLCCLFIYGAAVLMAAPGYGYGAVAIEVFYFLVNAIILVWCAVEFMRTNLPIVFQFWKKQKKKDMETGSEAGTEL